MYRFLVMNKMLSVFFFISVFTITLFEFICADQVEIFAGGAKLANVSVNLSLAYMSAFIFYIVIAYYPENSKRKHLSEPMLIGWILRKLEVELC
ncbi:hypothetical protein [Pseudoalteromonas sp. 1_2015MBL_MicDiv]|uniref:hypothetical protein n=1 Tax=Pseudoalteromonas sp. 1_2015MBL_MicDiv TaxID=1720343 RepID=UPI000BBE2FA9|nr:hypothetical protein [Pseudoalteromonas sp. 1_2015MBL_MicDiv]ATG79947.1 hypothetical protein AOR04_20690 [Pseudoalteromonas sp. 1_2015MBL_MicDiv]